VADVLGRGQIEARVTRSGYRGVPEYSAAPKITLKIGWHTART
jgi:hypothetical protein